ncbi:MAG TPA: RNA polymerase sigma factor [Dongiaceae bacterium]|nr:RNA polymerase sigma factor [Dongiaceae bacterium]
MDQLDSLSHDDRRVIRGYLDGATDAIGVVDGWIDTVLKSECNGQRNDWDDLRQEVRIRVLANLRGGHFHGDSGLRTYVHRIARNTAIDHWRRAGAERARVERSAGDGVPPVDAPGDQRLASRDLLRKIVDALTPEERLLLTLVHVRARSYADIARDLGVAEGTVKARVFRCRARLLELRKRLLHHEDA